jgi:soluble lytic murein transglycosylase-like protein
MELSSLIESAAARHGLPAGLVEAVVGVESGGNTWALRYEPAFYERYVRQDKTVRALAPCSLDTERQSRATSWGLMQVMGATARGLGFDKAFLSELTDPAVGLEYGCRLLARLGERHKASHGWPGAVAAYNAGSVRFGPGGGFVNQAYVDKIARKLGKEWPT